MSAPLTIPIIQSRRYLPGDRLQIEVDDQLQPDRVAIWGAERGRIGYGRGRYGRGRYGRGRSLGYGVGAYGRGIYGQGARILQHETANEFPAGDYSVRARALDRLGNAGEWSDPVTHYHRPAPPKPTNLRVVEGSLTWSWAG